MTATQISDTRTEDAQPDLREALARTQQWVTELLASVSSDQLTLPTPCAEFDVAALVRHLYGVADRIEAMGYGRPATSVPPFLDAPLPDDLAAGYRERAERSQTAWVDDASLTRMVVAPFGPLPGAQVIGVYVSEQLAHGWDLAVATGQPAEAAPDLVALGDRAIRAVLDPLPRGGQVPFGPAVEPASGAGPTERLAAYLGRSTDRAV